MQIIFCTVIGYLIGNINTAYIISRLKGFDIRDKGSGNAGASNVTMVMGKKAGFLTAVLDISKAVIASEIGAHLFPKITFGRILAGSACIMGHIFPFIMRFHGGKGLACLAGMILSFDPGLFSLLLLVEIVLALSLDYICVVPITGSVIFTVIYALTTGDPNGTFILAIISVVILEKHIINLKRIQDGTEAHISFLWNKDQELDRINKNRTAH